MHQAYAVAHGGPPSDCGGAARGQGAGFMETEVIGESELVDSGDVDMVRIFRINKAITSRIFHRHNPVMLTANNLMELPVVNFSRETQVIRLLHVLGFWLCRPQLWLLF
ncbi:unnamed protein product, partial [Cuscuta epithymum]